MQTVLHSFTRAEPDRVWTLRDIARYIGKGGAGPALVGAPEQIADQLEDWCSQGVGGFDLSFSVMPDFYRDFIDGVVPVPQRRGRMQCEYRPGTLRETMFQGADPPIAAPRQW
ncbi:MAG: monooxygenase [Gammaproteobacteria bacterium]|nr:monooxygenase [Gammaproteobacteria bacterium]